MAEDPTREEVKATALQIVMSYSKDRVLLTNDAINISNAKQILKAATEIEPMVYFYLKKNIRKNHEDEQKFTMFFA